MNSDSPQNLWQIGGTTLDLRQRGVIMGILNVTPDSFSDGGHYIHPARAVERALSMAAEGAEILDIGGESTRPGSLPVPPDEEMKRVLPVLRELRRQTKTLISIDTAKSEVARRALDLGADIINDVTALRGDPAMIDVVEAGQCGIVLMHMRGTPADMQQAPAYREVVDEVRQFLQERAGVCVQRGIARERICLDPGIGFGKTRDHNRALLRSLPDLTRLGFPIMVGVSRKAFLGQVTGLDRPGDRVWAGAAVTSFSREAGARIFRVHDVRENLHALRVTEAILSHV